MGDVLEGGEAGEEGGEPHPGHETLAQPVHLHLPGLPHKLLHPAVVPLHRREVRWRRVLTQAFLRSIRSREN